MAENTNSTNVANVTCGKPKIGGSIFRAPIGTGTTIPNSATSVLGSEFKNIGYISEDGVTNTFSPDSDHIKAWGGDKVINLQKERPDDFKFKLIESLNVNVLKMVFGNSNVTGTLESGITVKANSADLDEAVYVIDMVLKGNVLKRIVIPVGKITEVGDVVYADEDLVGYDTTLSCLPDTEGNSHYEYIIASGTPSV